LDVNKVQALSQFLIGLSILQRTDITYCNREIIAVKSLIEEEIGIKK
jgi:hypothetical protein